MTWSLLSSRRVRKALQDARSIPDPRYKLRSLSQQGRFCAFLCGRNVKSNPSTGTNQGQALPGLQGNITTLNVTGLGWVKTTLSPNYPGPHTISCCLLARLLGVLGDKGWTESFFACAGHQQLISSGIGSLSVTPIPCNESGLLKQCSTNCI